MIDPGGKFRRAQCGEGCVFPNCACDNIVVLQRKPRPGEFGHSEPPLTADPVGCERTVQRDDLLAAAADFIDAQAAIIGTLALHCERADLSHEQLTKTLRDQEAKSRTVVGHLRRCV